MRILLIGNGGREHAIAMAISKSSLLTQLYALPGNPGISEYCECVDIYINNYSDIYNFVKNNNIDLVIIGPEVPICDGLSDILSDLDILVFAPNKMASALESSKKFTKEIAFENNIPTAKANCFSDAFNAKNYLNNMDGPYVIKADGLAAGKGVSICDNIKDAREAVDEIFSGKFGLKQNVLIEEFLDGEEISYFALTDGKNILPLMGAQDHKRLLDGDRGPNTGGMGAYCPPPLLTKKLENKIINEILEPTLYGLNKRNILYTGVLFAGLMVKNGEPKLIEYNIRFGDPETQAMMMLLKSDFVQIAIDCVTGNIKNQNIEWYDEKALTIVLANKGYPKDYNCDALITGIKDAESNKNIKVFHAGTSEIDGNLIATGGRVLNVTSRAKTISEAQKAAYAALNIINFKDMIYRKDIAWRAL
tara:strand:+ start:7112 stop:8371 length:1260 start_codon:yes stop_codon:yes gene_type:complete